MSKSDYVFLFGEITQIDYFTSLFSPETATSAELSGYSIKYTDSGRAFLCPADTASRVCGTIAKLSHEHIWLLDQWKEVPILKRTSIAYKDANFDTSIYIYENNGCIAVHDTNESICYNDMSAGFAACLGENTYGKCDIHLMFPCVFDDYDGAAATPDEISTELLDNITFFNTREFHGSFFKQMKRTSRGIYRFYLDFESGGGEFEHNKHYYQPGFVYFSVHESTNIGIVSIVMPNTALKASHILQAFCGECLDIVADGASLKIRDWLDCSGIRICGMPKVVVFAHNQLEENDIINCLALESPQEMGAIISKQITAFARDNIAQYEIACVYASNDCLLEIEKDFSLNIRERFQVQATEIFFVELILLQVASIGKVCERVVEYMELQKEQRTEHNTGILIELSNEMFNVANFLDFNKFYFPTVRCACQEISMRFGMQNELARYSHYRELLEQMVNISSEEREKIEDSNMNLLLLVLAIMQVLPTLEALFGLFMQGSFSYSNAFSWGCSIASCFVLCVTFSVYKHARIKRRISKRHRGGHKD